MGKKINNERKITLRLSEDMYNYVCSIASRCGMSVSETIRSMVIYFWDAHHEDK